MTHAFIALGSNLGQRAGWLAAAYAAISLLPGTRLLAFSSVEETAPFGAGAQGPYLNQMLAVETTLPPLALLDALQRIERALGRRRRERWGARIIDLDIVRYGAVAMRSRALTLPHPGLPARRFWRDEIAELEGIMARAA